MRYLFDATRAGTLSLRDFGLPEKPLWQALHPPQRQKRAEDFLVREIDQQGYVCEATCRQPPNIEDSVEQSGWSFVLTKYCCSTESALRRLSKAAGIGRSSLQVSGRKDTFALTSQRVQLLSEARAFSVAQLPSDLWVSGWRKGCQPWHQGNHFRVSLWWNSNGPLGRERLLLQKVLAEVAVSGFTNFYGPQRFGLMAHAAGRHLLREEHEEAIRSLLSSYATLSGRKGFWEHQEAIERFLAGGSAIDARRAVMRASGGRCLAAKWLDAACHTDATSLWATMGQDRKFATEAVSSLLWNYLAAFRVMHYGNAVVAGDVVKRLSTSGMEVTIVQAGEEPLFSLSDVYLPRLLSGDPGVPASPRYEASEGQPLRGAAFVFPALPELRCYARDLLRSWGLPECPELSEPRSRAAAWLDGPRLGAPFRALVCRPRVTASFRRLPAELTLAAEFRTVCGDVLGEHEAARNLQLEFALPAAEQDVARMRDSCTELVAGDPAPPAPGSSVSSARDRASERSEALCNNMRELTARHQELPLQDLCHAQEPENDTDELGQECHPFVVGASKALCDSMNQLTDKLRGIFHSLRNEETEKELKRHPLLASLAESVHREAMQMLDEPLKPVPVKPKLEVAANQVPAPAPTVQTTTVGHSPPARHVEADARVTARAPKSPPTPGCATAAPESRFGGRRTRPRQQTVRRETASQRKRAASKESGPERLKRLGLVGLPQRKAEAEGQPTRRDLPAPRKRAASRESGPERLKRLGLVGIPQKDEAAQPGLRRLRRSESEEDRSGCRPLSAKRTPSQRVGSKKAQQVSDAVEKREEKEKTDKGDKVSWEAAQGLRRLRRSESEEDRSGCRPLSAKRTPSQRVGSKKAQQVSDAKEKREEKEKTDKGDKADKGDKPEKADKESVSKMDADFRRMLQCAALEAAHTRRVISLSEGEARHPSGRRETQGRLADRLRAATLNRARLTRQARRQAMQSVLDSSGESSRRQDSTSFLTDAHWQRIGEVLAEQRWLRQEVPDDGLVNGNSTFWLAQAKL
ncbi:unnamed protein product [Effrenium voratum]|nr:unnamed protein product [Effrenium voratum]